MHNFFSTFSFITHYIVTTEFYLEQSNLQDFILPAIISVFVWMMSISYLLLSLALDDSRKSSRLIYKDQDLESHQENKISDDKVKDNEVEGSLIDEEEKYDSLGTFKRLYHFLMESVEYIHPDIYGWRIKFRRLFLTIGTLAFTYTTINTAIFTAHYSSKDEIQKILDYAGIDLTWPDSGSCQIL